jgi:hypothetical protein
MKIVMPSSGMTSLVGSSEKRNALQPKIPTVALSVSCQSSGLPGYRSS